MFVDLTQPLDEHTHIFPGDPPFCACPALTIEKDGCNVQSLSLGTHTGTHIDAPSHFIPSGDTIGSLDPKQLICRAVIADVRNKSPRSEITWTDLAPVASQLKSGVALVLHTGWSQYWATPIYEDQPYLSADAAQRIIAAGVRTLAIDALSPDPTGDEECPVHKIVLGSGAIIAENLTNIEKITFGDPILSLLPLKVVDGDGSPIRAVAWSASAPPGSG